MPRARHTWILYIRTYNEDVEFHTYRVFTRRIEMSMQAENLGSHACLENEYTGDDGIPVHVYSCTVPYDVYVDFVMAGKA